MDHAAYVQRVRLGWHRTCTGWSYETISQDLWEAVCLTCGDDGGPPMQQPATAQMLRVPRVGVERANAAVVEHVRQHRGRRGPSRPQTVPCARNPLERS